MREGERGNLVGWFVFLYVLKQSLWRLSLSLDTISLSLLSLSLDTILVVHRYSPTHSHTHSPTHCCTYQGRVVVVLSTLTTRHMQSNHLIAPQLLLLLLL
jgi:hypothetical protein